ncbi:hypothetical protein B0H34DRAFT_716519 [Crassisporium funariophilum]|nr:hypothetical protein B0H34DRAFT_716519 [Crassisporium funariophilum]
MPLATFRIVDSDPELAEAASLHPRAIWRHWQKNVFWDHRTYYGVLEILGASVVVLAIVGIQEGAGMEQGVGDNGRVIAQQIAMGVLTFSSVSLLHWHANQRHSTHFLTRALTHLVVLLFLATIVLVSQLFPIAPIKCNGCVLNVVNTLLWLVIPFSLLAAAVIHHSALHPHKHPALAELPSPIAVDSLEGGGGRNGNQYRPPWGSANVADGVEDDAPVEGVEGGVRLV